MRLASLVTMLGARIHATATFDGGSLVVATAGGTIERVSTDGTPLIPRARRIGAC